MWEVIGGVFSSVLSGGATGLLGILFQRYFDYKKKQQEIEVVKLNLQNAIDLKRIDKEIAAEERQARIAVADKEMLARMDEAAQERAARETEAEVALQQASYGADAATYLTEGVLAKGSKWVQGLMGFVDFVRGLIRPVLTAYLVIIAHLMYTQMYALLQAKGNALTNDQVIQIVVLVINTLLYLATTSVVWWFGTRPTKRNGDK